MSVKDDGPHGLFSSSLVTQQTKSDPPGPPDGTYTRGGKKEREWSTKTRAVNAGVQPATRTETNFRHRGWLAVRSRVAKALAKANVPPDRLARFLDCGANCSVEMSSDGSRVRLRGRYCSDRFCGPCCSAKARIVAENLMNWCHGHQPLFITLTLTRTGDRVGRILSHLLKSFARLRASAAWAASITAGAYTVEMTRGKKKDHWHVHLHVIALGSFLHQADLSRAWGRASNGSTIVHITRVKGDSRSIAYTAAYAAKGYDASCLGQEDWIIELVSDLRGRRLLGTFGDWRGRQLERDADDRTDWCPCGTLDSIVRKAAHNDAWALGVLRSLHVAARWTGDQVRFDQVKQPATRITELDDGAPPG